MLETKGQKALLLLVLLLPLSFFFGKKAFINMNERNLVSHIEEFEDIFAHKPEFKKIILKIKEHEKYGYYLLISGSVTDQYHLNDLKDWLAMSYPYFEILEEYTEKDNGSILALPPLLVKYSIEIKEEYVITKRKVDEYGFYID